MDQTSLLKNTKDIDLFEDALQKDYRTFFLINPNGMLDSVVGLENLSDSFYNGAFFKTVTCYACLSCFECPSDAQFSKCSRCQVLNFISSSDSIGRKVIMVRCCYCRNRNVTNVDSTFLRCYLCHSVNLINYCRDTYLNSSSQVFRASNFRRSRNRRIRRRGVCVGRVLTILKSFMCARICKCMKIRNNARGNMQLNHLNQLTTHEDAEEEIEESNNQEEHQIINEETNEELNEEINNEELNEPITEEIVEEICEEIEQVLDKIINEELIAQEILEPKTVVYNNKKEEFKNILDITCKLRMEEV